MASTGQFRIVIGVKLTNGTRGAPFAHPRRPWAIGPALSAGRAAIPLGLLAGTIAAIATPLAIPLAGLAALAGIWIWSPVAGLAILLMSRSSLDWFQDATQDQAAFLFNPASGLGVLLIAVAVLTLALKLRTGKSIEWGGRVGLAWGGWVLFSSLGLLVSLLQLGSSEFASALREYVRLVSLFAVYFLVVNLATDPGARRLLLWATLCGIVLPVSVGAYQLITGETIHSIGGVSRIYGTFVHPNSFGRYLAAMAMISLGLWQDRFGGPRGRVFLSAVLVLAISFLIFTYSRSSLGILLFALVLWGMRGTLRRKLAVLGGVLGAAAALAPFLAWRFADLLISGDPAMERTNSFIWRLLNYKLLWGRFLESPIVGFGLRGAGFVNPVRTASAEGYERGFAAHNEVVRILVEQGALGLIAYVAMAVLLLTAIRRFSTRTDSRPREFPGLGRALYCLMWSFFILSAAGTEFLSSTAVLYVLFTVLGVLHVSYSSAVRPGRHASTAAP